MMRCNCKPIESGDVLQWDGLRFAVALTGGIATGKSTVASFFRDDGVEVIDADKTAHTILQEQRDWIVQTFGAEAVAGTKVDRKRLGKIVFEDSGARQMLERKLHPLIRQALYESAMSLEAKKRLYVLDIPLYFETSAYNVRPVVVVYAPKAQQLKRLMQREGLNKQDALRRIEAQLPIDLKKERADLVIENTSTIEALYENYRKIYHQLRKEIG